MKITHQDTKQGIIKVIPETLDDLWHLSHIIEAGDLLSSQTTRRIQDTTGDKLRSDRGVKKTFYMGIIVETIKFHLFTGKLRATGIIKKGPEEFIPLETHHTIEVKLNKPLTIEKEKWSRWLIKRLQTAVESSKKLSSIIIIIEDDTADIGLLRQFGIEYYGPIIGNISGKRVLDKNRNKHQNDFYNNIINTLNKFQDVQTIILAGPGFVKNDFYKYVKDKDKTLSKKIIIETTGAGGRAGIHELLKNKTIENITSENIVSHEMGAVNKALEEISKTSNKVVYGKEAVQNAANLGAIEELLIIDTLVREEDIENMMNIVENMNGKVMIISSEHDGGKQLQSLGGLIALLRYQI